MVTPATNRQTMRFELKRALIDAFVQMTCQDGD